MAEWSVTRDQVTIIGEIWYKDSKLGTFLNIIFLVSVKRRMDDGGMVGWCDISILILLLFCFIFET